MSTLAAKRFAAFFLLLCCAVVVFCAVKVKITY